MCEMFCLTIDFPEPQTAVDLKHSHFAMAKHRGQVQYSSILNGKAEA